MFDKIAIIIYNNEDNQASEVLEAYIEFHPKYILIKKQFYGDDSWEGKTGEVKLEDVYKDMEDVIFKDAIVGIDFRLTYPFPKETEKILYQLRIFYGSEYTVIDFKTEKDVVAMRNTILDYCGKL